jgi:hypothetical protein
LVAGRLYTGPKGRTSLWLWALDARFRDTASLDLDRVLPRPLRRAIGKESPSRPRHSCEEVGRLTPATGRLLWPEFHSPDLPFVFVRTRYRRHGVTLDLVRSTWTSAGPRQRFVASAQEQTKDSSVPGGARHAFSVPAIPGRR